VILSDFNSLISNAIDPIVLDLDHNGFAFSSLDNGVSFDIDADGHTDQIAWTSADGILAYDLDSNGRIDNGSEIFTPSFNGGGHASGIAALATLDSNGDGKIDAEDDAFSKLSIWVDANHNGISDDGELSGLLDHSITSISLDTSSTGATEDGQAVLSKGHFTLADGSTGDFLEVGFDTLLGGQPDHVALGGDGDDILMGGAGFSQFTGGAGADTFVFDPAALQSLDMADVVTDYKVGEGDVLDVSGLLDSMLGHQASAEEAAASIRTTVTGADTTVSVQVDDSWKDVAVLQNHTEAVKILFDDKHTIDVSHH
jgi:Ca2+-binding RTX toxin-like protein